jgi:hypothetical protein
MMTNFEIMKSLENIQAPLSKAVSIVRNNYLIDPPNGGSHPAGVEREVIFEYLAAVSDLASQLHMILRVEDHPEMMEDDHREEEREANDIPF